MTAAAATKAMSCKAEPKYSMIRSLSVCWGYDIPDTLNGALTEVESGEAAAISTGLAEAFAYGPL